MIPIFSGDFQSREDIEREFDISLPETYEILYASYDGCGYDGDATVIYRDTESNLLFEVHGSHCSCYGLEEQWIPENTIVEYFLRQAEVQENLSFRMYSYPTSSEWRILAEYCNQY